MALTVYLQDEHGGIIDDLGDPQNAITRLIEPLRDTGALSLMRYVDPYADTIFNHLQMPALLRDIARLDANARESASDENIAIVSKLRELAERCRLQSYLYLKFYGD